MTSETPGERQVREVARLAGLRLTPTEVSEAVPMFARLLTAFRVLAEADVADLEPLYAPLGPLHPGHVGQAEKARTEPETPRSSPVDLLANAPETIEGHFAVPRTVGEAE